MLHYYKQFIPQSLHGLTLASPVSPLDTLEIAVPQDDPLTKALFDDEASVDSSAERQEEPCKW